ncbi:hypothetical protein Goari_005558 [Gossypium aridum]|uniref:Uncharacterized protein n=1 Tax=Gossypium aridum TaxID=34290 RepID=A0A7J8YT44_GOSAI|nr:hypothetical protein [Gossypium aridum]
MNKYLQQLEPYTFIQEHRFDPVMRNCKGIWENVIEKEWNKLCLPSEELIVIPIVQEFYLALKQREATRPFYGIRSIVKVRGINVLVIEMSICQFYDVPYYYRDYSYKKDLKELKNRHGGNAEILNGGERDVDISNMNNST